MTVKSKENRGSLRSLKRTIRLAEKKISSQSHLLDPDYLLKLIMELKPEGASGAYEFKWNYLSQELLSKLPREGVPQALRQQRAVDKMLDSEVVCARINSEGYGKLLTPRQQSSVLCVMQNLIAQVLGPLDLSIFETSSFSSGATTHRLRKHGDPYFKYDPMKAIGVTPGAYKYAVSLVNATPLWKSLDPMIQLCASNSIFTVPKSTDIDRAACKEPCLNNALQRAVGSHIRKRLKRVAHVNLNDQTINQRLAEIGSLTNQLSTIDLSSASDSISQRLVWDLLPKEWSDLLNDLRSRYGKLPNVDNLHKWEKHSTMGNGYTFELESLIFWAAAKAAQTYMTMNEAIFPLPSSTRHSVSVYGDDIICPRYCSAFLINLLDDIGFKTNIKKTFIDGPFRESCGKHYFNGVDVSPFYIRKPINSVQRVIWFLNSLRVWGSDITLDIVDPLLYSLWCRYRRLFIPPEFLGGVNVQSICSVASPETRRFEIGKRLKTREIDGTRALLRCFQFNNVILDHTHVKWYEMDYFDDMNGYTSLKDASKMDRVAVQQSVPTYTTRVNDSIAIPFSRFPQEYDRVT